jgi:hypothetical protein
MTFPVNVLAHAMEGVRPSEVPGLALAVEILDLAPRSDIQLVHPTGLIKHPTGF